MIKFKTVLNDLPLHIMIIPFILKNRKHSTIGYATAYLCSRKLMAKAAKKIIIKIYSPSLFQVIHLIPVTVKQRSKFQSCICLSRCVIHRLPLWPCSTQMIEQLMTIKARINSLRLFELITSTRCFAFCHSTLNAEWVLKVHKKMAKC